jgi:hypothetical protein
MKMEGDQVRKTVLLVTGLGFIATSAWGQVLPNQLPLDCTTPPGCETKKYGLGLFPEFRADKIRPEDNFYDYTAADFGPDLPECVGGPNAGDGCEDDADCGLGGTCRFGVSYYWNTNLSSDTDCTFERGFYPYPGQIHLRERTDCEPSGTGPTCAGGPNAGQPCRLMPADQPGIGYRNIFAGIECPGSSCQDNRDGCRVEIPITDGGGVPGGGWTAPEISSSALLPTFTASSLPPPAPTDPFILSAHAATTWGGSSHGFCTGGPTPGAMCNADAVCGAGGSCTRSKGLCQSGPNKDQKCTSDADCGGAAGSCKLVACNPFNFREKPSMGTRYILPASRGGDGTKTYVRWDYGAVDATLRVSTNTALRSHSDDSTTCCQSTLAVCTTLIPGSNAVYPVLNQRDCSTVIGGVSGRNAFTAEDSITPDWIFAGGRGTAFSSDPEHVLPGQISGLCRNNRQVGCTNPDPNAAGYLCTGAGSMTAATTTGGTLTGRTCCTGLGTGNCPVTALCTGLRAPYDCCTGSQTGTCGTECNALGDTCDRSEGHRTNVQPSRTAFGEPRPTYCQQAAYIFRGTPDRGCTLTPQYLYPGDPGHDCGTLNYGSDRRSDTNCDGVPDVQVDTCPFVSEWDEAGDSDHDCPGPSCRGNECECGDQDGNGSVTVSDIVDTNLGIFGSVPFRRLCDGNSDLATDPSRTACDVSDMIAANVEIFNPDSSSCREITSGRCGNSVIDPGEACDDGARCGGTATGLLCDATAIATCTNGQPCLRIGGDGCNTSCRLE